ncbi:MAG: acyltransferase [Alphaproteobacteria bacterium]
MTTYNNICVPVSLGTAVSAEKAGSGVIYRPFGALRFFLAVIVLLQHALHLMPSMDALPSFGVAAVAVFFAISGFIVVEANATFYAGRPGDFLLNRVLRIVPPYLAAMVLSIAIHQFLYAKDALQLWDTTLHGSPMEPVIILSGLVSILPGMHAHLVSGQNFTYIPFAWTLRIELTFYLLAFAVYAFRTLRWRYIPDWLQRWSPALILITGYVIALAYMLNGGIGPRQQTNIPWFLFGISLYLAWHHRSLFYYGLLCFTTLFALAIFPLWPQRSNTTGMELQLAVLGALSVVFIGMGFVPRVTGWVKVIDKHLGDLAYALYINHFAVLLLMYNLTDARGLDVYFLGMVLSMIVAIIMHRAVEIPLQRWRDKIRGTKL